MTDLDVNGDALERDEATGLNPFKRCAECEGLYLDTIDGWCLRCLNLLRSKVRPFLRAEYHFKVKLPEHIFGKGPHLFVTRAAAEATALRFGSVVEEL